MIILMALIDMIGVASIMPFIAVLSNPEIIETNSTLNFYMNILASLELKQHNNFFIFRYNFYLLVFSLSFKALTILCTISIYPNARIYYWKTFGRSYLNQPYSWFLIVIVQIWKNCSLEVRTVVSNGISPLINLIANL